MTNRNLPVRRESEILFGSLPEIGIEVGIDENGKLYIADDGDTACFPYSDGKFRELIRMALQTLAEWDESGEKYGGVIKGIFLQTDDMSASAAVLAEYNTVRLTEEEFEEEFEALKESSEYPEDVLIVEYRFKKNPKILYRQYVVSTYSERYGDADIRFFDRKSSALMYADELWGHCPEAQEISRRKYLSSGGAFEVYEVEATLEQILDGIPPRKLRTRSIRQYNLKREELLTTAFNMRVVCTASCDEEPDFLPDHGTHLSEEEAFMSIRDVLEDNCFKDWSVLEDMGKWRLEGEPLFLSLEITTPDHDVVWRRVAEVGQDGSIDKEYTDEEHLELVYEEKNERK